MKKILVLVLAVVMAVTMFTACGEKNTVTTEPTATAATKTDLDYIKENGKLVVGITDFAPMDYQDADGKWIGFDADMATAFAEKLGVTVEFVVIEWDNKVFELNSKKIDCVWNGMTLGDEVKAAMDCSNAYCDNAQVVIVRKDKADAIKTAADCAGLTFAVEAGSAGEDQCEANNFEYNPVTSQADALSEVKAGTSDAAIIDSLMAAAMVGEGTGYADLAYTVSLNSEQYGVGFRKGSNLVAELNTFFKDTYADGTLQACAEQYKVQAALIEQK